MSAVCAIEACVRPVQARGWCTRHYGRWRRYGDPTTTLAAARVAAELDPCAVDGCVYPARYKRWCVHHALRSDRYGDVKSKRPQKETTESRRLRLYGITPEKYRQMLRAQGGGCAVCGGRPERGKSLHVDHDHACCSRTGMATCGMCVRGLLCSGCNTGLGSFGDDRDRLASAIRYLEASAAKDRELSREALRARPD